MSVKYLIVILIPISQGISDTEYIFTCLLAICICFLVRPFAYFKN